MSITLHYCLKSIPGCPEFAELLPRQKMVTQKWNICDHSLGLISDMYDYLSFLENRWQILKHLGTHASEFAFHCFTFTFIRRFYPKRLTVHSGNTFFSQYMCSLGIEPTTFALLTQCSNHWATGTQEQVLINFDEYWICFFASGMN